MLVEVNDGSKYYGTLTSNIADRRQAIMDTINEKLKPFGDEQAKVDSIKKDLDKYDLVQLKNTDQGVIKNKLVDLGNVNTSLIKDGEANETLVATKARAKDLLAVFDAYSKEVSELDIKLKDINGTNVTSSNLELINVVIKILESYKASNK